MPGVRCRKAIENSVQTSYAPSQIARAVSYSPSARVPAELTDHIIDFLHSDRDALEVCSLVGKSWLPCARFHLFEHVQVSDPKVDDFFACLSSPLSTMRPAIRSFHANMWKSLTGSHLKGIAKMAGLRSLRLHCLNLAISTLPETDEVEVFKLKDLSLECESADHLRDILAIPCIFPNLETLTIGVRDCVHSDNMEPPSPAIHLPPALRHLTIVYEDWLLDMVDWMCLHDPLPPIRSLCITSSGFTRDLSALLGESLESIRLMIFRGKALAALNSIDFAYNTKLNSLHLEFMEQANSLTPPVGMFVSRLRCPSINHVRHAPRFTT